jgi:hypothetical protein
MSVRSISGTASTAPVHPLQAAVRRAGHGGERWTMSLRVGCALLAGPRLRVARRYQEMQRRTSSFSRRHHGHAGDRQQSPCLCSSIWPESQDPDVPTPARYGSVPQGARGAIPDSAEEAAI